MYKIYNYLYFILSILCPTAPPPFSNAEIFNMAFPNDQLFLDRFIAFNKRRYADEPEFVEKLNNLSLQNTIFSNFRELEVEPGVIARVVDVDVANVLTGDDQQYLPADYVKDGTAELQEPDPLSLAELKQKGTPGIYFLGVSAEETVGAVLVYNGKLTVETIKTLVKENCYFDLADEDIEVNEDRTLVTLDSRTIVGVLQVVEGLYDDIPRYNGQFRYDGTISY